jgi:hypothetical protein
MAGADAHLESCITQARTSLQWFQSHVLVLSSDELRWRPRLGSWSVGECLDHMNLTFAYYLGQIEQALDRGQSESRHRKTDLLLPESEYLRQVEPPVVLKAIAPVPLQPNTIVDPDRIVEQFTQLRERYGRVALSTAGLDSAYLRIADTLHVPIQSVSGAIVLLAAHDRRHLRQAELVQEAGGFGS